MSRYTPAQPAEGTGSGARLSKQVQADEAHLRQAVQTLPSQASPPEFAKQTEEHSSDVGVAPSPAADNAAGEQQAHLQAVASTLLYLKGGLKVLRQVQLPQMA